MKQIGDKLFYIFQRDSLRKKKKDSAEKKSNLVKSKNVLINSITNDEWRKGRMVWRLTDNFSSLCRQLGGSQALLAAQVMNLKNG